MIRSVFRYAVLAFAASWSLLTIAPAQAAEAQQFCAIALAKPTGSDVAVVVSESCSTQSPAAARDGLSVQVSTKLMTWYKDAGWLGTSADIFGSSGTCDTAGYSFVPSDTWKQSMSSIKGYQQCNRVRLTNIAGTSAREFPLPVSFGATLYNDNVGRVSVYHR